MTLAFWRGIWRTFLLQAAWNFERMQNLGFLYAMLPVLRETLSGEALHAAIKRHAQFFNTHPYFASTIIGAMAKLEEDAARNPDAGIDRNLNALKVGLMGSLGAVGDSLFWSGLRPFAAWVAILLLLVGDLWLGVAFFLAAYNIPHLLVRFGGAAVGYAGGLDVVRQLRRVDFPQLAQRLKGMAVAAAFAALPLVAWRVAGEPELRSGSVLVAAFLFFVVSRGIGGTRLAAGFLAVIVFGSWLWNLFGGQG